MSFTTARRRTCVPWGAAFITMLTLSAGTDLMATQTSVETRTQLLLTMLPYEAQPTARLVMRDSASQRTVRRGDGFICISTLRPAPGSSRISNNCHHPALGDMIGLEQELANLDRAEFRRQLCVQARARGVRVPKGAMEITSSIAVDSTGKLDSTMTVYHLLWMPFETRESLGVVDEDPGDGRPWLHRAGTCQAHVMWSDDVRVPSMP